MRTPGRAVKCPLCGAISPAVPDQDYRRWDELADWYDSHFQKKHKPYPIILRIDT